MKLTPLSLFGLAAGIYLLAMGLPFGLKLAGCEPFFQAHTWLPHFLLKTALVGISLVAMWKTDRSWAKWGFTRPNPHVSWWTVILSGGVIGAVATATLILSHAKGLSWLMRDFGFLGVVVWIWFYSSLTEEIFTRGWFQGMLAPVQERQIQIGPLALPVPVLLSGILFGTLHLSLLMTPTDTATVVILVTATTLLGVLAAWFRHLTQSLYPAIVTHIAFNIGSFVGGVLVTILLRVVTGKLPNQG